ncbi:MAG: hypothetical protein JO117_04645, partial [Verrucomicrobia bacterium]|nr:hypothetical protein [Verrucomicrobiota bacterium]
MPDAAGGMQARPWRHGPWAQVKQFSAAALTLAGERLGAKLNQVFALPARAVSSSAG